MQLKRNVVLFYIMLLLLCIPLFAQQTISEYTLKAAYTQRFTKFIDWPTGQIPTKKVTIGILGRGDSFLEFKKFFKNKKIKDLPVEVIALSALEEGSTCDILFVEGSIKIPMHDIITHAQDHSTLIIGNQSAMAEQGAMISFFLSEKKLRFKINVDTATDAGFKISSFLLEPATIIRKNE